MNMIAEYKKKTKKSAKIFTRSKKYHVNGVHHNIRFFKPYPFVTKSAKSKFLIDVDSNRYVDYWMGHWSLILGHSQPAVKNKVQKQLEHGWIYGTVNNATMNLSEIIQKTIPVAEKIRYVSSGTEAAMYAIRLARSFTGKKIVAKIDGGWHGYASELLKTVNWPFETSESSGLLNEKYIVSLPYNNLKKSLEILETIKNDLACTIIEPLLGGGGCILADTDYLKGIQEFVQKNKSLFLLDEIVTGFRFKFGCLYTIMNLDPDIVILGKIVGGGFPIGVICGKKDVMKLSDISSFEKSKRSYIGGGTFSANPVTMTAGFTALSTLKKNKNKIYPKINNFGKITASKLTKIFDGKVKITGKGSLFMTHFIKDGLDVKNSMDVSRCNSELLYKYHFEMMVKDGIFFLPGKLGAISAAHSKNDLNTMFDASERFSENMT